MKKITNDTDQWMDIEENHQLRLNNSLARAKDKDSLEYLRKNAIEKLNAVKDLDELETYGESKLDELNKFKNFLKLKDFKTDSIGVAEDDIEREFLGFGKEPKYGKQIYFLEKELQAIEDRLKDFDKQKQKKERIIKDVFESHNIKNNSTNILKKIDLPNIKIDDATSVLKKIKEIPVNQAIKPFIPIVPSIAAKGLAALGSAGLSLAIEAAEQIADTPSANEGQEDELRMWKIKEDLERARNRNPQMKEIFEKADDELRTYGASDLINPENEYEGKSKFGKLRFNTLKR